jgi:hypothetical protein
VICDEYSRTCFVTRAYIQDEFCTLTPLRCDGFGASSRSSVICPLFLPKANPVLVIVIYYYCPLKKSKGSIIDCSKHSNKLSISAFDWEIAGSVQKLHTGKWVTVQNTLPVTRLSSTYTNTRRALVLCLWLFGMRAPSSLLSLTFLQHIYWLVSFVIAPYNKV